jgi:hypothetical protein
VSYNEPMGVARRLGAFLLVLGLSGCGTSSGPSNSPTTIPSGVWGALGVEMNVSSSGADISFCCSTGQIPPPLTVDASGHFDFMGTITFMGGPVPITGFKPQPARYTGSLNGNTMTLIVSTAAGVSNTYTLTFGTHNTALCVCPL